MEPTPFQQIADLKVQFENLSRDDDPQPIVKGLLRATAQWIKEREAEELTTEQQTNLVFAMRPFAILIRAEGGR